MGETEAVTRLIAIMERVERDLAEIREWLQGDNGSPGMFARMVRLETRMEALESPRNGAGDFGRLTGAGGAGAALLALAHWLLERAGVL